MKAAIIGTLCAMLYGIFYSALTSSSPVYYRPVTVTEVNRLKVVRTRLYEDQMSGEAPVQQTWKVRHQRNMTGDTPWWLK